MSYREFPILIKNLDEVTKKHRTDRRLLRNCIGGLLSLPLAEPKFHKRVL